MKGEKMMRILEVLNFGATRFIDLTYLFLITPKGRQHTIDKKLRIIEREREREQFRIEELKRFKSLITKMKHQGLVGVSDDKWLLTDLGQIKLKRLRDLFLRRKIYQKEEDDIVKIVAFDVPEKFKKHREWLRFVLKNLGFKMLQKSVWLGKAKIPKELLIDLKNFGLADCVEIIGITRSGTLKEIV